MFFFFLKHFSGNFIKEGAEWCFAYDNNNSRDLRITAKVPLLNLNLNYEKLRHKDSKFYLLNNIDDANFCIL